MIVFDWLIQDKKNGTAEHHGNTGIGAGCIFMPGFDFPSPNYTIINQLL